MIIYVKELIFEHVKIVESIVKVYLRKKIWILESTNKEVWFEQFEFQT